ncbi:CPBP family intramembrane glutamic endopeptidase [Zavarzinella formosa]|uniref:CPBP family intramembrane glutamic endopeptidase n=1 Tax=Zavarzinella formosa TaxID=360055 RepID=UPI00037789C9|nr:CPBP family intramembrane glutamic endopeptidase [Zavarzinella formosa]
MESPPLPDSNIVSGSTANQSEEVKPAQPKSGSLKSMTPPQTDRAIFAEVMAVMAVGVIPYLLSTFVSLAEPPLPPLPFWLGSIDATIMSCCTIFVTIYLISRSGEPWERFGLPRVSLMDALAAVSVFIVEKIVWLSCYGSVRWDKEMFSKYQFAHPTSPTDHGLMVLRELANGFSEELVMRAYLLTRLEHLLGSRVGAVLMSALLFASYHGYQGVAGVAYTLEFGIVYGLAYLFLRRVWPLALAHAMLNIQIHLTA